MKSASVYYPWPPHRPLSKSFWAIWHCYIPSSLAGNRSTSVWTNLSTSLSSSCTHSTDLIGAQEGVSAVYKYIPGTWAWAIEQSNLVRCNWNRNTLGGMLSSWVVPRRGVPRRGDAVTGQHLGHMRRRLHGFSSRYLDCTRLTQGFVSPFTLWNASSWAGPHTHCLALSHLDAIGYNYLAGIACWPFLTWTHSNYMFKKNQSMTTIITE